MNVRVLARWLAPLTLWALVVGAVVLALTARSDAADAQVIQDEADRRAGVTPTEVAVITGVGGVAEATVSSWVLAADAVPMATTTVRLARINDLWDVLVAVTLAAPVDPSGTGPPPAPSQRFYVLSIDAATLSPAGAPAQVATPDLGGLDQVDVGESLDDLPTDAATTITGFLDGLLAAGEAMDRYVTPDSPIEPITPAPYDDVTVDGVVVHDSDGTDATVTVNATGHADTTRSQPLQYMLQLRHGTRWEVVAIVNYPHKDPQP